jgi:hypothetical protein
MWVRQNATRSNRCSVLRLLTSVVVGCLVLNTQIVRAQGTVAPAEQPLVGWVFTPSISFGGTWDDNVLLVNPGPSVDPPADYQSPIGPGLSLGYTGKRTRFSTGYSGSMVRYHSLDALNSFHQSLRATMEHRLTSRLSFFAEETFASAPTTDVLQLAGVPFYRTGSRSNVASGGVQAALAKHTSFRANYTLHSVAFEQNPLSGTQLQGGHAHEVRATLDRALSRRLVVGGEYEFTRAIVNGRSVLGIQGPEDRFNIQNAGATASYEVADGTTVTAGLGIAQLGGGLTHQARTGPEWRAGVSQRAGRGQVSASYRRAYIPSFGFGGTMQNEQWAAHIRMPLGRTRAYVAGGVSWYDNDPLETDQPSLQSAWLSTAIGYYATRWLTLEGFYGRTQQNSQRAGGQLERNQLGFRILADKPMKLR